MIVKKNSWHYSLVNSIFVKPSKSLCTYFWQIVGSILIYIMMVLTVVFMIAGLVGSSLFALWVIFTHGFDIAFNTDYRYMGIVGIGMSMMIFTTVFGVWRGMMFVFGKIRKNETKPNIATEYIKAKKEKVCPRITFE